MAGLAIQQIFYSEFRPVIFPPWQSSASWYIVCVYMASIILVTACVAIIFDKKTIQVSIVLGIMLLLVFCFCQVPYMLLVNPYYKHLGVWADAQKEIAFAGGAFVIAGSYITGTEEGLGRTFFAGSSGKLIPIGSLLFCSTMISFGLDHLFYPEGISLLVPRWIHGYMFWTYFAGAALIASGIAIILSIHVKLAAILLGVMILLWFIVLHIPRAIADPFGNKGNEVSSVLESFGFSGICYLMACGYKPRIKY